MEVPPPFLSHSVPEKHGKKQRSHVCNVSSCVYNQEIVLLVVFPCHSFKNCIVMGKTIALVFNPWSVWKRFLREPKVCIFEDNSVAIYSELLDFQILLFSFCGNFCTFIKHQ